MPFNPIIEKQFWKRSEMSNEILFKQHTAFFFRGMYLVGSGHVRIYQGKCSLALMLKESSNVRNFLKHTLCFTFS